MQPQQYRIIVVVVVWVDMLIIAIQLFTIVVHVVDVSPLLKARDDTEHIGNDGSHPPLQILD